MSKETDDKSDEEYKLPAGTPVFGTEKFAIRLDSGGDGAIEVRAQNAEYEFSVDGEQVQEFAQKLNQENSGPSLNQPDCISFEEINVPDGWEGGRAVHTGGGIWARRFTKDFLEGWIEVGYDIRTLEGVGAGLYGPECDWLEEIDWRPLSDDADEEDALKQAHELIEEIDSGTFDILGGE